MCLDAYAIVNNSILLIAFGVVIVMSESFSALRKKKKMFLGRSRDLPACLLLPSRLCPGFRSVLLSIRRNQINSKLWQAWMLFSFDVLSLFLYIIFSIALAVLFYPYLVWFKGVYHQATVSH